MIQQRRYDLDWLRVISVFAVFLHHILMPFNGDDFHIMNTTHSKFLDDTMVYFEQFRLPLLFLVSGVGTVYAFSKRTWLAFALERVKRLLVPLVFGVLCIVPPQVYYENIINFSSFLEAYNSIVIKFKVNHLWFIENLFIISILFIPFVMYCRSNKSNKLKNTIVKLSKQYRMISWVILLLCIRIITKEYFPSNEKSIRNLSSSLYFIFFFVSGVILATNNELWKLLHLRRKYNLRLVLVFTLIFYGYYFMPREWIAPYLSIKNRWRLWYIVSVLVSWSVVITILGYGKEYLNKESRLLVKLNEAVYPFYILHQTIIIIIGYYVLKLDISILFKILILFFSSFCSIILIYMTLIYPFKLTRFLFGMKIKRIKNGKK
ncbi:acyltransferase family protein [Tenacibaculum agarivorans]|uniref:acyltransferase family protein n=1 Tax=Tenacibaculum agarivorans TaxID=1908389 RepID=UPI00094BBCA9|nr:acyltransferase [Tenacibaculum agarivorans]